MKEQIINSLALGKSKRTNILIVTIKGDSNDADYVTEISGIDLTEHTDEEITEICHYINEVGVSITSSDNSSYEFKNKALEETFDLDWIVSLPHGEDGVHSIELVSVQYFDEDGVLYE